MTRISVNVLAATLALISAIVTVGAVIAFPFGASAQATVQGDETAERIVAALEALAQAGIDTGVPARKSYRMDCAGDVWPHIGASCLAGAPPKPSIRVIY